MSNQEKAREIELDVYAFGEKPKGQFEAPAYRAALAMAEWKDTQFREYLENQRNAYLSQRDNANICSEQWAVFHALACTLHRFITELFGEEKRI